MTMKKRRTNKIVFLQDPQPLKRCEMFEIEKYYDDRWMSDYHHQRSSQRRSSNEDEGVEEDFSSSGSGIESQPTFSSSNRTNEFEELTQMMRNSLTALDRSSENENRSSNMAKTYC